jgi:hypothetical protein
MYITSCSWGWSGPYSMAEYPGHAAATEPDMCCIGLVAAAKQGLEPHWSSLSV